MWEELPGGYIWWETFLTGGKCFWEVGGVFLVDKIFSNWQKGRISYGIMLAVTTILGYEIFGIRIFFGCW